MKTAVYAQGWGSWPGDASGEIVIGDACDPAVAHGVRSFYEAKRGYGVADTKRGIWPLLRECVDGAAYRFSQRYPGWMAAELIQAAKGVSELGAEWREKYDRHFDGDYIAAKKEIYSCGETGLREFIDTIACLRDVIFAAWKHLPKKVTSPDGGVRLRRVSSRVRHFPYCELCWRKVAAVTNLRERGITVTDELDARDKRHFFSCGSGREIGSVRLCLVHQASGPNSKYRADVGYRETYWRLLSECRRELVMAWKKRLRPFDEQVPIRARSVLALLDVGLSVAQVEEVTQLSSTQIELLRGWADSPELSELNSAEAGLIKPSEELIRQAAYLLMHEDIEGLLCLDDQMSGMVVTALRRRLYKALRGRLSEKARLIARMHRKGFQNKEIAIARGVSRQVVSNTLRTQAAKNYLKFFETLGRLAVVVNG